MKTCTRRFAVITGLALAAGLPLMGSAQAATTVVVGADGDAGWTMVTHDGTMFVPCSTTNPCAQEFETGPGAPPAGTGSLEHTIVDGSDAEQFRKSGHGGTLLSDVGALSYSTYREGAGVQVPYLQITVDTNGDTAPDAVLMFEPAYNADQQPVLPDTWQTWDAVNGTWWDIFQGGPPPLFTWADYVATNPTARVLDLGGAGIRVASGGGWGPTVVNVDNVTIGIGSTVTTYDFELLVAPTSADQCKKGGYASFNNPTFKNQGQCVSYVNGRR